ncbi:MAG: protein kinase [candidate division Zixibacteria bacterium]|nr:protein kinase [candidate division Zixibacteria bacterium]
MLKAGQDFAHFKIIRKLGEGGMGQVFLAEDTKLGRQVGLKILVSEFFDDAERRERFTREARMAARINHPGVMSIHDIGSAVLPESDRELHYIVTEYIEGEQLTEYLRDSKPGLTEVLRLSEKIASGLAAAHKLGIVHRDIKADNIMINAEGDPRILDFGLAKPFDSGLGDETSDGTATISKELTRAGKILGTVSYMSPEQAQGKPVDARSDLFSFGILLYRMVTGELPFDGGTQVSTLAKILESRHEPPRTKNAEIPSELERIIDKCLQKNANDRYQNTRDLVLDLRSLRRQVYSGLTDSISGVTTGVTAANASPWYKRWKRVAVISFFAVILLAALISGILEDEQEGSVELQAGENSLAILGFENKTGDADLDWLQTGLPEIFLTDLAQGKSLRLISRERVLDCLDSEQRINHTHMQCVQAAQSLGARNILSGAYYKLGDKIRIDARMEDAVSGNIVLAEKVVGEDPFTLVDSLTAKIAASLDISEFLASDRSVTDYTSSSPQAYRLYLEGVDYLFNGLWEDAIDKFEQAVALDSTFALPYMRLGMAYAFQNKGQEGRPYFAKAKELENSLPPRERSLLDAYTDVWLKGEFDAAFAKMEAFVNAYPDDKEGRTIYALFIGAFTGDTLRIFAQLDTALAIDPSSALVLGSYAEMAAQYHDFDKALKYSRRLIQYHSKSPSGYFSLASILEDLGRFDESAEQYRLIIERFPDNSAPYRQLYSFSIRARMFDSARYYADRYGDLVRDDAFRLRNYYRYRANIENWQGNFVAGIRFRHLSLEQALASGDSARIAGSYSSLGMYFHYFKMADSARYYLDQSYGWYLPMNRFSYSFGLVELDPRNGDSVRVLFEKDIAEMRSRLPSEIWGLVDALEEVFDANAAADTTRMIAAQRKMIDAALGPQGNVDNSKQLATLYIETGKFDKGKELLLWVLEPERQSTGAYTYLTSRYYYGRACEGLGENDEAVKAYSEVLKYWGEADIEIDAIREAKARLARLTS